MVDRLAGPASDTTDASASFSLTVQAARLPLHGGAAPTVIVTMDLQTLLQGIGVATTDAGGVDHGE